MRMTGLSGFLTAPLGVYSYLGCPDELYEVMPL